MLAAWQAYETLGDAIQAEFAAAEREAVQHAAGLTGTDEIAAAILPLIYTPGLANAEIREQAARLRSEVSAGSMILILDNVFQRLRSVVWDVVQKSPKAGEFRIGSVAGGHLSTVVYAAGNAYRHIRDWEGAVDGNGAIQANHPQIDQATRSLNLLAPVVDLARVANETICVATVSALCHVPESPLGFDGLPCSLNAAARDFAAQYCDGPPSFAKVREALDYQDAMRRVEFRTATTRVCSMTRSSRSADV